VLSVLSRNIHPHHSFVRPQISMPGIGTGFHFYWHGSKCTKKRDSCRGWCKEMKILPLCSQYIYSLMPYIINNIHLFVRNAEVHNINTRQKVYLFPPSTSFIKDQKGAYYSGIKIYNHLPRELKQLSNDPKSFEPALKRFLRTNSFYTLNEYFNYRC
jgi:hypothetical protein